MKAGVAPPPKLFIVGESQNLKVGVAHMKITWAKPEAPDPIFLTEIAKTEEFGDVGYIYKEAESKWISVYIYENGDEGDRFFTTATDAKSSIVEHLEAEILEGRSV